MPLKWYGTHYISKVIFSKLWSELSQILFSFFIQCISKKVYNLKKSQHINISKYFQESFILVDSFKVLFYQMTPKNLTIFYAWVSRSHFCEIDQNPGLDRNLYLIWLLISRPRVFVWGPGSLFVHGFHRFRGKAHPLRRKTVFAVASIDWSIDWWIHRAIDQFYLSLEIIHSPFLTPKVSQHKFVNMPKGTYNTQ